MENLFEASFLRKLDRLALVTRRAMGGEMQGERRSPRRGTSVEFADFRPYTTGDDFRQIDWNLYARAERFFLKLFVAEEELTFHLLLDSSASMDWGTPNKLHYARRLLAAFGYIALSGLDRVTITSFVGGKAHQLPGVRGKRGALPLFTFLQKIAPSGPGNLAAMTKRYSQTAKNGGPLLLCSDLLDPTWKEALRILSSRSFEITLLHVLAPEELEPQIDGDFRLLDSETNTLVEVTADLDLLNRYQQNLAAWRSEIETFCHGRKINYLFVNSALPLEDFVLNQVRKRGVLK